jgi:hypothetical protein
METALANPVPAPVRRLLFGLIFALLLACAIGYGYWKAHPAFALSTAPATPEQTYYKQLVYAVNELHNQVERDAVLQRQGKLTAAQLAKGKAYAASLMTPLTSPPEELSIAQYITDKLYRSYQQYVSDAEHGAPALQASYELTKSNYELFRQNAEVMKLLNSYSGVNIDCH